MMEIISVGALPTASLVWQPKPGSWTCTVVCKATFVLAPGESPLAEEQEQPNEQDGHWDDDPRRSLCFASDLMPIKTHAEVTVVGHAFAPGNMPVRSLIARVVVGELDRSIEVWTDRTLAPDGTVHEGPPFSHMPIVYERARGGPDSWNPVGIPADACDAHGHMVIPNLQAPGVGIEGIEPVGWGPIPPSWPGRASKLGRRAMPDLGNLANTPLPWGFDLGFFCSAPPEMRLRTLRDSERIVLEHLHPEHPRLTTRLPGVRPRAYVDRGGAAPSPVTMRADTLAIDTDRGVCTLTFRGHFPIARPDEQGRVLIAVERGAEHRSWAEVVQSASAWLAEPPAVQRASLPDIEESVELAPEDVVSMTMDEHESKEALFDTLPFARPVQPLFAALRAQGKVPRHAEDLPFVTPGRASAPLPAPPPPPVVPPPSAAPQIPPPPSAASPVPPAATGTLPPAPPAVTGTLPPVPPPPVVAAAVPPPPPVVAAAVPPPPPSVPGNPATIPAPPPSVQGAAGLGVTGSMPPAPVTVPSAPARPGAAPPAPILRSLGPESPWAGGAPSLSEPARGTIGTLAAAQSSTQAEAAAIKDASTQNAVMRASNAAAGKSMTEAAPEPKKPAAPAAPTVTPPPPGETGRMLAIPSLEVVDLLWFERAALPRIRKNPAWRALVQALEDRPPDPDLDDATLGNSPAEVEDRRDVFEVLARGSATDAAGIEEALSQAVRADGKVVPPFVLAAGDLAFPFDEVETLKAHVAIISPLAAGDEKLRAEIALVRDFLSNPELACAPPMVEALSNRLWEAFGKSKRAVPADTLKAHSDSVLLQKRRFQKREVFGGNHLRALLHAGQGGGPFPAYLPAGLAAVLPMYQKFRARLFAEVHMAMDQHESCPTALRVVAVARVVERVRRPPPAAPPVIEVPNPRDSRPG